MADFLQAARRVLEQTGGPMTAQEITSTAITHGWLVTSGRTPSQTMKARLSDNILRHRESSPFMRTDKGKFGLRDWKGAVREYVADRYQKALLDEDAVVFDAELLPKYLPNVGLHEAAIEAGDELVAECRPMLRRQAEEDESVIQLVSAFVVRWDDRYLTYKRSARLPEQRLHGEYSLPFGGHLTPAEISPLYSIFDPHDGLEFLLREFREELRVERRPRFTYRGLIYDDRRALSRQHLGIVYEVNLVDPAYEIGERGFLLDDKFETLQDMTQRIQRFDNWSELLIRHEWDRLG